MVELEKYLQPTYFLDCDKRRVKETASKIVEGLETDREKAIALFYWVRDEINYTMYTYLPKYKTNLKASTSLRRMSGFCMSKAVLLATLARAVGIPARIHMVDIINHKAPDWVEEFMGTKAFHCHGYSELFIEGRWFKLTPVFDKITAQKAGYLPLVEFDGEHDALLASHDPEGNRFVEYIHDWGVYQDVPLDEIEEIFIDKYGEVYTKFQFRKPERK